MKITMQGYIDELLSALDIKGAVTTPATMHLFDVRDGPPLPQADKEHFHTVVAKLLYLAKRVRPDILTAVAFLAFRVTSPILDDMEKLSRVLEYLNGCSDMGIVLRPGVGDMSVQAHVDDRMVYM